MDFRDYQDLERRTYYPWMENVATLEELYQLSDDLSSAKHQADLQGDTDWLKRLESSSDEVHEIIVKKLKAIDEQSKEKTPFEVLNAINVNDFVEEREGLKYLSWANAWKYTKEKFPDASYVIWRDEQGRPYTYDENLGYMVYTSVTIMGFTHEMWLPVMDSKNKAMKNKPYKYSTKYGERQVESATMFDINKTIMRCLVKNLAMFGLGLYIYSGEDLPDAEVKELKKSNEVKCAELRARILKYIEGNEDPEAVTKYITDNYKCKPNDMAIEQCEHFIKTLEKNGKEI